MGAIARKFRLINNTTDEVLFEGSLKEISEITGATIVTIRDAEKEQRPFRRGQYRVIDISEDREKANSKAEYLVAAMKWDEFCEPIRKKYGIPVYKPRKGGS